MIVPHVAIRRCKGEPPYPVTDGDPSPISYTYQTQQKPDGYHLTLVAVLDLQPLTYDEYAAARDSIVSVLTGAYAVGEYYDAPNRILIYFWGQEGLQSRIPERYRPVLSELPTIDLDLESAPVRHERDGVPLG